MNRRGAALRERRQALLWWERFANVDAVPQPLQAMSWKTLSWGTVLMIG